MCCFFAHYPSLEAEPVDMLPVPWLKDLMHASLLPKYSSLLALWKLQEEKAQPILGLDMCDSQECFIYWCHTLGPCHLSQIYCYRTQYYKKNQGGWDRQHGAWAATFKSKWHLNVEPIVEPSENSFGLTASSYWVTEVYASPAPVLPGSVLSCNHIGFRAKCSFFSKISVLFHKDSVI